MTHELIEQMRSSRKKGEVWTTDLGLACRELKKIVDEWKRPGSDEVYAAYHGCMDVEYHAYKKKMTKERDVLTEIRLRIVDFSYENDISIEETPERDWSFMYRILAEMFMFWWWWIHHKE